MPLPDPLPGASRSERMRFRQAAHLLIQVNNGFTRMAIIRRSMALMQHGRVVCLGRIGISLLGLGCVPTHPFFACQGRCAGSAT